MTALFKVTDADRRSFPGRVICYVYEKGQLVESDSLGIFLFKRRKDAESYINRFQTRAAEIIGNWVSPDREPPTFPLEIHRVKGVGRGKRMPYCPVMIYGLHGLVTEPVVVFKNTLLRHMRTAPYVSDEKVGQQVEFKGHDVLGCPPGTVVYPGVYVLD